MVSEQKKLYGMTNSKASKIPGKQPVILQVREELHDATLEFKAQQHSFGKKVLRAYVKSRIC